MADNGRAVPFQEPKHLLVPIDFSAASAAGLRIAGSLAERFGARITVVHAEVATSMLADVFAAGGLVADADVLARSHRESLEKEARSFVRKVLGADAVAGQAAEEAETEGAKDNEEKEAEPGGDGRRVRIVVRDAVFAAEEIVDFAAECGAEWICMGATGRRLLDRLLLGSIASEVLRRARIPVLTARPHPEDDHGEVLFDDFRRVLVAVDLGESSQALIDLAAALAGSRGELTVLHVIEEFFEQGLYGVPLSIPGEDVQAAVEWAETALAKRTEQVPDQVLQPLLVRVGRPGRTILAVERELEPDVTVIGRHGRHGAAHLGSGIGSVADRIAREAHGPVLVVPAEDRAKEHAPG